MSKYRMIMLLIVAVVLAGMNTQAVFAEETAAPVIGGWTSAIGKIQEASNEQLLINDQLSQEKNRLSAELTSLQKSLVASREKKQRDMMALQERRSGTGPSGSTVELKNSIAQKERALELKKTDLARLKAREKTVDDRIALRKLKIADLELEKKTLLLDQKVRVEAAAGKAKTDLQLLQDKVVSQTEQEKYIRAKIEFLKSNAPPYIGNIEIEAAANTALKQEVADLESKRKALVDEQSVLSEKRTAIEKNRIISKIQSTTERRDALKTELAALKEKQTKLQAEADVKAPDVPAETSLSMAEEIKKFEAENKKINEEVSNLRENIAVLDYEINTLGRYRSEKVK